MNRFNLTTEKWIPIEGGDKASLKDVFSTEMQGLVQGNAIQKISIYKLLFAIAQDAIKENEPIDKEKLSKSCITYLEDHYDCFWLYGEKPFLQYPELAKSNVEDNSIFCSYIPDLSAENDTIFRQTQTIVPKDDGEKAVFILGLMSYSLGGKRVSNPELFLINKDNRGKSAKAGPSIGGGNIAGYQQSILISDSIIDTIYLNYFSNDEISRTGYLSNGVFPPWIKMPTLEKSDYNESYKKSIFTWYLAMCRAVLLTDEGIRYCEGIQYTDYWFEPFITKNAEDRILIVDTQKKPWRNFAALLSEAEALDSRTVKCMAISEHLKRARNLKKTFGIWSGGLRVRGNSGDQSIKRNDDFVESVAYFDPDILGEEFYHNFREIIDWSDYCGKVLYSSIQSYYTDIGFEKKNDMAKNAMNIYWSSMNQLAQRMADSSDSEESAKEIKLCIFRTILSIYDNECQKNNSRQIVAWTKNRPLLGKEKKK